MAKQHAYGKGSARTLSADRGNTARRRLASAVEALEIRRLLSFAATGGDGQITLTDVPLSDSGAIYGTAPRYAHLP
jgi:hypothetical protein